MRRTRYFLDTEFIEAPPEVVEMGLWRPGILDLISIGIVSEDGGEFYAISSEFAEDKASDWVRQNVLSKLSGSRETRAAIKKRLLDFIGETSPEFWGYFADYDWVLLCWLMGRMIDLPPSWPKFCLDLKQEMHVRGLRKSDLPRQPPESEAHNALTDAKWIKAAHAAVVRKGGREV